MVPNGWNETKLGDVIKHQKGYAFKSESYKKDGIRIIRISDTSRNSIHDKSPVYLAEDASESLANYKLREDDIILSTVGSRPHLLDSMVGKAVKLRKQDDGALLNQNLVKVSPKPNVITNDYLFSMLTKSRFIYFISTLVRGNANQVSITLAELFSYKFLLPPYDEQRKIAKILSTWDKAISTIERLIDNSKQQKRALMQQLLTGKKRLLDDSGKPFEGEWEDTTIESTSKCFSGGTPSRSKEEYYGGQIPWITSGKLNDRFIVDVNEYITELGLENSSAKVVKKGSILIAMYGATAGKVAINKLDNATINQAILALETKYHCHNLFMFYLLDVQMQRALNLVQGGQPNLSAAIIKTIKIRLPSLLEQKKIASVLSNADKEIELLEQQLADLKQEKKALMQQLLTGKRRVKI